MHTLRNDRVELEFNDKGNLTSLQTADGKVSVPLDAQHVTVPVEVQLRDDRGHVTAVTPTANPDMKVEQEGDRQVLTLCWTEKQDWGQLAIRAAVALPDDSPLSSWSIEVDNHTDQAIFQVAFPRLSGLRDFDQDTPGWLAVPCMMGEKTPHPVRFVNQHEPMIDSWARHQFGAFDTEGGPADIAYAYPGYMTMQFLAYGHPDTGGLYLGANDPQALFKCFGMYAEGDTGKHAVVQMKQYPRDRTEVGADFTSFYECPVGIYRGDWWNASALYRPWALKQFWTAKGPLKDRDDVPDWVKNNDLWYWNWQFRETSHPSQVVPIIKAIKQKFDCELGFHWYGYNGRSFGNAWRFPLIYPHCPETRAILKQGVKALHDAGVHCIPYLDVRLMNPDISAFKENNGMNWICVNEKGDPADPWPRLGHTMCPTTPFFHDLILGEVEKMMDDCDMDGAYLDQISGCYPVPCFNPAHDHPPGGHDHWVRGYRQLLERVRAGMRECKPDSVITSEGVTECFMDMFDLDLAREIANLKGHVGSEQSLPIPMFHSVYHDYHISYGTVSTFKPRTHRDTIFMEHFYYSEALTLVGGGQLMISGPAAGDETNEKFKPFFDYMETLTRTRKAARRHFNLGRWLPPLPLACDTVDIRFSKDLPPKQGIPAVLSGCFEYDGEVLAVLVNHTREPRTVRVNMHAWNSKLKQKRKASEVVHPKETRHPVAQNGLAEFSLPALSTLLIRLSDL